MTQQTDKPLPSEQLVLELPHRAAMGRDDFLVAPSNAAAVDEIDHWPNWRHHALIIAGPPGSGKSHLATVFASIADAQIYSPHDLVKTAYHQILRTGACVVEDLGEGALLDETALFHLLNYAREHNGHVLMTSREPSSLWGISLPDLATRLAATPLVTIDSPDDTLLRGILVKLFDDRQLAVDEAAISYMLKHMERSGAAAQRIVAEIDNSALKKKAEISRTFIANLFRSLERT
ncbi:MAG: chromosomal replication initiator DnaA [Hyphomicrobiales bacterium]